MARRRYTQDDGSLELLLDTITNAFGGILFLAILVVVLLKGTGKATKTPASSTTANLTELTEQLQNIEAELATVSIEIKALEAISANLADADLKSTLSNVQEQRRLRNELNEEKRRLAERLTHAQEQLANLNDQSEALTQEITRETESLETLQGSLDQERAKRKIRSPFPEERAASKDDYSVTMRYGRWYVDRSEAGLPNLEDFAVLESEGAFLTVTPKPYRGTLVIENGKISNGLVSSLQSRNPSDEYICIAIWDDSYIEFQAVRDYLVERGFEYRLIALTEGDVVTEGYVPNPQVQ